MKIEKELRVHLGEASAEATVPLGQKLRSAKGRQKEEEAAEGDKPKVKLPWGMKPWAPEDSVVKDATTIREHEDSGMASKAASRRPTHVEEDGSDSESSAHSAFYPDGIEGEEKDENTTYAALGSSECHPDGPPSIARGEPALAGTGQARFASGIVGVELAASSAARCLACLRAGLSVSQAVIPKGDMKLLFREHHNKANRSVHLRCGLSGALFDKCTPAQLRGTVHFFNSYDVTKWKDTEQVDLGNIHDLARERLTASESGAAAASSNV